MSRISFENFGRRARAALTTSEKAGRYDFQREAEARIVSDVADKMRLCASDRLLEIGCGTGNLLLPLSELVGTAHGIDHADCIAALREREGAAHLGLIEGNFLDVDIAPGYDKILVYSVIHYLSNLDEVRQFISRAAALLGQGGVILIGDIPNEDRRQRFLATPEGQRITAEHEAMRSSGSGRPAPVGLAPDPALVRLDDQSVSALQEHMAGLGLAPRVLAQPPDLPFGYTREDVIAEKR